MQRLKELGTWVLIVIAFWLFSNGIMYIIINQWNKPVKNTVNNTQIVNQEKM